MICSCSDDFSGLQNESLLNSTREIRIQGTIDQNNATRADDSGFANEDIIGVYAVNYTESLNPGMLLSSGNLINNVAFTFDESNFKWTSELDFFFKDDKTPVDFYGYYPYNNKIENVNSLSFSVEGNQSVEASVNKLSNYESSDFLWAKTTGIAPSQSIVNLYFKHIFAGLQISLVEGDGFGVGEWDSLEKSVLICNTKLTTNINLQTGETTDASGEIKPIITSSYKNDFRGVVIPQIVGANETLLSITVDGHSYDFKKSIDMNYMSSKMHKFSILVNKHISSGEYEFSLLDESITAWESDPLAHNGLAKEYVCVTSPECGMLAESIKNINIDTKQIKNLKIDGKIDYRDFEYIRKEMPYIEAINLKNVELGPSSVVYYSEDKQSGTIPYNAFRALKTLSHVVMPDKLKRIGDEAFLGTHISGSLDFPDGLEYIGNSAFNNTTYGWDHPNSGGYGTDDESPVVFNNLTGTLNLPTSLKYIGEEAFANCDFTGSLVLPESLEYIGRSAFEGCSNLTGELHLPNSLKYLGDGAFGKMTNIRGKLEIPNQLTEISGFNGLKINSVIFNDILNRINDSAFTGTTLTGVLRIPETVTYIGNSALAETKLTNIIFPSKLEFIEPNVCRNNKFLQDTISIPPMVESIGEYAFANCEKIEALVLPSKLSLIRNGAFENCFSLNYIHCEAKEPPMLEESAFYGVNKDNFTIEVPEESVDAYRTAPGWSEFKRIASYKNFVARPSKYNVLNKGGKKEFVLNADGNWTITACPEWCHVDKTSGYKKTTITLSVDRMNHNEGNRSGIIEFKLQDTEEHFTHINVTQCDYEYEEDSYILLNKATKGAGVDLFFVGDGYDAFDIANGTYLKDIQKEVEYFFGVEPYTTYNDYFNVYTAIALSEDSGVESLNHWRNTKFHVSLDRDKGRIGADYDLAFEYCESVVSPISNRPDPYYNVIVLANTEVYDGVTNVGTRDFCSLVTKSAEDYPNDARGLVQHEAGGHGIGHLADEYIYHQEFIQKCKCFCCMHLENLLSQHSTGFGLNISQNGKYKEVPWSHLIFNPSYVDIVDIYEGGYFHSRGVYRSESNSCMNNNVAYFSTWSRQLIVERIMKMAGEQFDINKFYANDSREVGKDFTSTSRSHTNSNTGLNSLRGNAPRMISNYSNRKKGGNK